MPTGCCARAQAAAGRFVPCSIHPCRPPAIRTRFQRWPSPGAASGAPTAPAALLESWRGSGLGGWRMFWVRPCCMAHVGSQLTAWENLEDCMSASKIKMFDEGRGFGFIKPDDGGVDVFFHVSALRDGAEITQGKAVKFEIGFDPKSGKTKAVSVDLT